MTEHFNKTADQRQRIEVALVSPRGCSSASLDKKLQELGVGVSALYRLQILEEGAQDQAASDQWQYVFGHVVSALVVDRHDSVTDEVVPLDASTEGQIEMAIKMGTPVYMTHPVDGAHDAQTLLQELGLRE